MAYGRIDLDSFDRLLPNKLHAADRDRAMLAIRASGFDPDVVSLVLDKRRAWVDYLCRTQRQWQTRVSRRPGRGRHHDSWDIREHYVRCHDVEQEQ